MGPPSSTIRIIDVAKTAVPSAMNLTFTVNPGETYMAQYSLNLATWTDTGSAIQPAAGATTATTSVSLAAPPLQTAAAA